MQQVAIPQSTVSSFAGRQLTACLRLSRGASGQATWLLEDVPGGTTIQIGADATCDWQIRAACVPDHALTAMLIGGTLFVKSAQEGGVLLDGRPLGALWSEVPSGSRIDIGLARIDVAIGEASSAFERFPQAYVPTRGTEFERSEQPAVGSAAGWGSEQAELLEAEAESATATFAELTQPQQQRRESIVPRAVLQPRDSQLPEGGRASRFERLSRPSLSEGAPALLEDERGSGAKGPALWKLAMGGLVTAIAYGGWLLFLDL